MAQLADTSLFDDANLVAYYKVEAGALTTDSKGAFTLTNLNTVADGTGKFGGGASYDTGSTDKGLYALNDLGIQGGAGSISFWFKCGAEPATDTRQFLVSVGDAGTNTGLFVEYRDDSDTHTLRFVRGRTGTADDEDSHTVTLGTANWHHIVITYDTTDVKGYLDGVEVASVASTGNGASGGTDRFIIGNNNHSSPTLQAKGIIDDVGVFTDALSPTEVLTLYNDLISVSGYIHMSV